MITVYITVFRCPFWWLRCLLWGLILCFLTFLTFRLEPICSSSDLSTWRSRWLRAILSVRWPTVVTGRSDLRCTLDAEGKSLGCAHICGGRGYVVAGGSGPRHRKVSRGVDFWCTMVFIRRKDLRLQKLAVFLCYLAIQWWVITGHFRIDFHEYRINWQQLSNTKLR